jgi:N-glycosylase/DNA lyase
MLGFTEIERLVEEQLASLSAEPGIANALRSYRVQGGEETDHRWRVAGFYAYETKNKRLVLEALYLQSLDTCVIRVFREARLNILYARKSVGDVAKLSALILDAAGLFLLHLKKSLPLQIAERDYDRVSKLVGQSVSQALSPIPPPVNLEDLES